MTMGMGLNTATGIPMHIRPKVRVVRAARPVSVAPAEHSVCRGKMPNLNFYFKLVQDFPGTGR